MSERWFARRFLKAVMLAVGLAAPLSGLAAEPVHVSFVLINDLDTIDAGEVRGGFSRAAALIKTERAANPNVLVMHAGDAIFPSLLSGFDQGTHIIELLNTINPDAMAPGNHEFDLGADVFRERMDQATFPMLAANLREDNGKRVREVDDTRMYEFEGVKIGVVGLTSDESTVKSSPGNIVFSDMVEALEHHAERLRANGADLVVALAHASRSEDQELIQTRAADLILSGDDHDLTVFYDGRTALAESRSQAEYVAIVDLTIDVDETDGNRQVSWTPGFRVIDTATVDPDPEIEARIAGYEADLSKELDVVLSESVIELDSRRATVRTQECAIGNLVADAMRTATRADVALTNGGGIRGDKVYGAGTAITRRDILTELPFGNKTVVVKLSGAQIKSALENGYSAVEDADGRFAHLSGMRATVDLSKPAGERVTALEIGGKPMVADEVYTLATNDFLLRGGDGYTVFGEGEIVRGVLHGNLMASDVMVFVRLRGTRDVAPDGRVTFVK